MFSSKNPAAWGRNAWEIRGGRRGVQIEEDERWKKLGRGEGRIACFH